MKPLLLLAFLLPFALAAQTPAHEHLLAQGWRFTKTDDSAARRAAFDDSRWQQVTVPHDWAVSGPFDGNNDLQKVAVVQNGEKEATLKAGRTGGLPFIGAGWYRRKLDELKGFRKGQAAYLVFDGAMSNAVVYVNGQEVGRWPYGYNSFYFEISPYLKPAGNVLAVRLENLPESSRWYPGAGLYRNVHLMVKETVVHIPVWGSYITTPVVSKDSARVRIRTQRTAGPVPNLRLRTRVKSPDGKLIVSSTSALPNPRALEFTQEVGIPRPQLWSPEQPVQYTVVSALMHGTRVLDSVVTRFGIRTASVTKEKGFQLNGVTRKFKGVCNHHDLGPLGAAVHKDALRRQLTLLKDLGADAIRTTHNMPAPELVELADEMGFMLIVESFDEWKTPKVKNGYSRLYDQWAEKDIVNMVRHYRNHPSVMMWSIGNEVPDQWAAGGVERARFLQGICHREDPTRPVTAGMDQYEAVMKNGFAAAIDVPGFNYKPHKYAEAHGQLPQGFLLGSETASTVSSRGMYKFPLVIAKQKMYADNQSSSYDLEYCDWSQLPEDEWLMQDSLPYTLGEFVWTGFDYLGEPTPYDSKWPSHSSYFGILDLAGLPKDRFYLYRSRWNTASPTLHLLPHWTWPGREGQVTPVFAYTSYPEAELFVNGVSQGRRRKAKAGNSQARYRLMWNEVIYQPGTIKVVAYDAAGKAAATEEIRTAGAPHHLELVSDQKSLAPGGLAYVTVRVVDQNGTLCPDAALPMQVSVSGAGRFRAIANGDPTCLEPFTQPAMKTFSGQLVVTVQREGASGPIHVETTSGTLKGAAELEAR